MSTPQELAGQMAQKTDQQLLDMVARQAYWTPRQLDAAKAELQKRNITPEPDKELAAQTAKRTDQQLLDMVARPVLWTPGALDAAKAELQRRNIRPIEVAPQPTPNTDYDLTPSKTQAAKSGELETCKQCGERVKFDEYGFCPKCGKAFVIQKTEQPTSQNRRIPSSSSKMPRRLWFILVPLVCLLGFALIRIVFFEKSSAMRKLDEPAYTDLKRELEAEGVEVRDIEVRAGGVMAGVFHGNEAVGSTWIHLDIVLNRPDQAAAKETSVRIINKFGAFAKSGKLGSVVERKSDKVIFLNIQYWKPDIYISDLQIEIR